MIHSRTPLLSVTKLLMSVLLVLLVAGAFLACDNIFSSSDSNDKDNGNGDNGTENGDDNGDNGDNGGNGGNGDNGANGGGNGSETITLSGTIAIDNDGNSNAETLEDFTVYATTSNEIIAGVEEGLIVINYDAVLGSGLANTDQNGTWEMDVPKQENATPIFLHVVAPGTGYGIAFSPEESRVTIHTESISDMAIEIDYAAWEYFLVEVELSDIPFWRSNPLIRLHGESGTSDFEISTGSDQDGIDLAFGGSYSFTTFIKRPPQEELTWTLFIDDNENNEIDLGEWVAAQTTFSYSGEAPIELSFSDWPGGYVEGTVTIDQSPELEDAFFVVALDGNTDRTDGFIEYTSGTISGMGGNLIFGTNVPVPQGEYYLYATIFPDGEPNDPFRLPEPFTDRVGFYDGDAAGNPPDGGPNFTVTDGGVFDVVFTVYLYSPPE